MEDRVHGWYITFAQQYCKTVFFSINFKIKMRGSKTKWWGVPCYHATTLWGNTDVSKDDDITGQNNVHKFLNGIRPSLVFSLVDNVNYILIAKDLIKRKHKLQNDILTLWSQKCVAVSCSQPYTKYLQVIHATMRCSHNRMTYQELHTLYYW